MKKYNITVNGTVYEVCVEEVAEGETTVAAPVAAPVSAPKTAVKAAPKAVANEGTAKVTSPMPGTILDVKVAAGQKVTKGQTICVLEAMKMENEIPAPQDGVVASVNVQKGSSVAANDVIVTLN